MHRTQAEADSSSLGSSDNKKATNAAFNKWEHTRRHPGLVAGAAGEEEDGVDDLITLNFLTDQTLLANIQARYERGLYYTYCGSILVAVNPYQPLSIYDKHTMERYRGKAIGEGDLSPHVYAIADAALSAMRESGGRQDQSIVISGESGAGKTETAKHLLKYFSQQAAAAAVATSLSSPPSVALTTDLTVTQQLEGVQAKILRCSPVLEAFGNAKTLRNDNSSRFGKFVKVFFDQQGCIVGAETIPYLLEKSRITTQSAQERNYHIFYQLCAGASPALSEELKLREARHFHYLNQGGCTEISGVDDAADFEATRAALSGLGLDERTTQMAIWKVLAAVLHLGEIGFRHHEEGCAIVDRTKLEPVCQLLGVKEVQLENVLCRRVVVIEDQAISIRLKPQQAAETRDAMSKALYSSLFQWLIRRLNAATSIDKHKQQHTEGEADDEEHQRSSQESNDSFAPSLIQRERKTRRKSKHVFHNSSGDHYNDHRSKKKCFIGILDIFGFENFQSNSWEQFLINYAGEKLQSMFNKHIFTEEVKEYEEEQLPWKEKISFVDNEPCIELIERRPMGILSILDEECRFPKATDQSFLEKLHANFREHSHYHHPRRHLPQFSIHHFAEEVHYQVEGFLTKNQDTLREELVTLLLSSSVPFVSNLFKDVHILPLSGSSGSLDLSKGTLRTGRAWTVGAQFKQQLSQLVQTLEETNTFYIRCIKPNTLKSPNSFDDIQVAAQLRYTGMLETVKIRKAGFPVRLPFIAFLNRYTFLIRQVPGKENEEPKLEQQEEEEGRSMQTKVARIFHLLDVPNEQWQIGRTKVFMRSEAHKTLEAARRERLDRLCTGIQREFRRHRFQQRFQQQRSAALVLQTQARRKRAELLLQKRKIKRKEEEQRRNAAALFLQTKWRKREATLLLKMRKKEAEEERRRKEEEEERRRKEEEARARKEEERRRQKEALAVALQRLWRCLQARKEFIIWLEEEKERKRQAQKEEEERHRKAKEEEVEKLLQQRLKEQEEQRLQQLEREKKAKEAQEEKGMGIHNKQEEDAPKTRVLAELTEEEEQAQTTKRASYQFLKSLAEGLGEATLKAPRLLSEKESEEERTTLEALLSARTIVTMKPQSTNVEQTKTKTEQAQEHPKQHSPQQTETKKQHRRMKSRRKTKKENNGEKEDDLEKPSNKHAKRKKENYKKQSKRIATTTTAAVQQEREQALTNSQKQKQWNVVLPSASPHGPKMATPDPPTFRGIPRSLSEAPAPQQRIHPLRRDRDDEGGEAKEDECEEEFDPLLMPRWTRKDEETPGEAEGDEEAEPKKLPESNNDMEAREQEEQEGAKKIERRRTTKRKKTKTKHKNEEVEAQAPTAEKRELPKPLIVIPPAPLAASPSPSPALAPASNEPPWPPSDTKKKGRVTLLSAKKTQFRRSRSFNDVRWTPPPMSSTTNEEHGPSPLSSSSASSAASASASSAHGSYAPSSSGLSNKAKHRSLTELELVKIAQDMSKPDSGLPMYKLKVKKRTYEQCFNSTDAVRWMMETGVATTLEAAESYLSRLQREKVIKALRRRSLLKPLPPLASSTSSPPPLLSLSVPPRSASSPPLPLPLSSSSPSSSLHKKNINYRDSGMVGPSSSSSSSASPAKKKAMTLTQWLKEEEERGNGASGGDVYAFIHHNMLKKARRQERKTSTPRTPRFFRSATTNESSSSSPSSSSSSTRKRANTEESSSEPIGKRLIRSLNNSRRNLMNLMKGGKKDKDKESNKEHNEDGASSANKQVFGVALEEMMARAEEKGQTSSNGVPRIVDFLCRTILEMDAAHQEGVFRVSSSGAAINEWKVKLRKANAEGVAKNGGEGGSNVEFGEGLNFSDVHMPCSLLKLWLRELPIPVFPDYYGCIAAESWESCSAILSSLPPSHRNLLALLFRLLREICKEENVKHTKMDISNLALIFAPCLLRAPKEDPMAAVLNIHRESNFLTTIWENWDYDSHSASPSNDERKDK